MFAVTWTLNTAIQYLDWTYRLMMLYHRTMFDCEGIISSIDIVQDRYQKRDLDLHLEDSNTFCSHDIPSHDEAPPYQVCLGKVDWFRRYIRTKPGDTEQTDGQTDGRNKFVEIYI